MSLSSQVAQTRDQLRAELLQLCTTPATRVRTTFVSDGAGGRTASGTATDAMSVFVAPKEAVEAELAGRLSEDAGFVMFVSLAEDVALSDTVTIGSTSYEVTDVLQPSTVDVLRVCGLRRIA